MFFSFHFGRIIHNDIQDFFQITFQKFLYDDGTNYFKILGDRKYLTSKLPVEDTQLISNEIQASIKT